MVKGVCTKGGVAHPFTNCWEVKDRWVPWASGESSSELEGTKGSACTGAAVRTSPSRDQLIKGQREWLLQLLGKGGQGTVTQK